MHRNQHRMSRKMEKQRNLVQTKEQDKISEKYINETERRDLINEHLKIMVIRMLTDNFKFSNENVINGMLSAIVNKGCHSHQRLQPLLMVSW